MNDETFINLYNYIANKKEDEYNLEVQDQFIDYINNNPDLDYGYIYNDNTLLQLACNNVWHTNYFNIISALINTGKSNPGYGSILSTALIELLQDCNHNHILYKSYVQQVALQLINTGESNPNYIDNFGNTALYCALTQELPQVAIALIKTGKITNFVLKGSNKDGISELLLAQEKGYYKIVGLLNKIIKKQLYNELFEINYFKTIPEITKVKNTGEQIRNEIGSYLIKKNILIINSTMSKMNAKI